MRDYFLAGLKMRCRRQMGLIAVLMMAALPLSAQRKSETQLRQELTVLLQNIQRGDYGTAESSDNVALFRYLEATCKRHPEMMGYDFMGLDSLGLSIETSPDRKLRIYCWDQWNGGTMHFYAGLVQYETAPGKTAVYPLNDSAGLAEGLDAGEWYSGLQSIQTASGKTVYLVYYGSTGSGVDHTTGIRAITIKAGKLVWDYPFFYTKTKKYGSIGYYYSLLKTKDFSDGDLPAITLSSDKKTLSLPVVTAEGRITRGTLTYRFDGEKFVFEK